MPPSAPKNIALTGFMAVGKTHVGRELARRLGWRFVDVDRAIEKSAGLKVQEIFNRHGEAHFRALEKEKLKEILDRERQVIATGGGAVLDEENLALLKQKTLLVCLTATPETILRRAGGGARPLLDVGDRGARVRELLGRRAPLYAQAHTTIDTEKLSVEEVVEAVLRVVQ
ncbi:MAG TPA: shikimate kinase [Verrucomicrobiae bacterium]|nr:shikimate kinase [Verrucomicrobiae bacterium]